MNTYQATRSISQTYYSPTMNYRYPQMGYRNAPMPVSKTPSGEVSRNALLAGIGFVIVLIVGWVILNFILYKDNSAWFKVYKAPPPPPNSVQPNGDGTGGSLPDSVNTFKNNNLASYAAKNPSTTPENFGGYISTPPTPP